MKSNSNEIATNRKAGRDYQILERFEAGVALKGTEVKSVRQGKINLSDAFARIDRGQCFLYNCDIQPYEKASHTQHEVRAVRRLLLHKSEIMKLWAASQQKGLAIPVLRAYWKDQKVKLEIAIGRGKTQGDQRDDMKKKAENREVQRVVAHFNEKGKGRP